MKRIKFFVVSASIVLLLGNGAYAQMVSIDSTFGQNGMTMVQCAGEISRFNFDNYGNIIAIGNTTNNGFPAIIKTDSNGVLDKNFGTNGIKILNYQYARIYDFKITNENKILLVGRFNTPVLMMQFNEDGSIDNSFGNNGEIILFSNTWGLLAINLEDSNFLLLGNLMHGTILDNCYITKHSYSGEADENFGNGWEVWLDDKIYNISSNTIKLLNDQSILVAGRHSHYSPQWNRGIAFCKFNQNGQFVTGFADSGKFKISLENNIYGGGEAITNVFEDSNGKLVFIGYCGDSIFVFSVLSNGIIDSTFGEDGFYFSNIQHQYFGGNILPNEDNYLIGWYDRILCVNNNGYLNTSFSNTGVYNCQNFTFRDIKYQKTNKLILGGSSNGNFSLARISTSLKANAGDNQHFCYGWAIPMTYIGGKPTASGGTPPYTYRWWTNTGNNQCLGGDTTIANPSILIHVGEITVYVEVTDADENTAIDSAVISMSEELPYGFFSNPYYLPIEHAISRGDSVWITIDTIVQIIGNATCRWTPTTGLSNSNLCSGFWAKPNVTTAYYLIVADEYGCSEQVMLPIHNITVTDVGTTHYKLRNANYVIYPNPTNGQLRITNYELRENTVIEIYDVYGKNLTPLTSHSSPLILDISHLANGMYFLKIDNKMFKIIKN